MLFQSYNTNVYFVKNMTIQLDLYVPIPFVADKKIGHWGLSVKGYRFVSKTQIPLPCIVSFIGGYRLMEYRLMEVQLYLLLLIYCF